MSTQYSVDLVFGTAKADSQLARMEAKLKRLDQAGGRDPFASVSRGASVAEGKIGSLIGVVGKLGGALALAGTAMAIFKETASLETQIKSIEVLTGSLSKTKDIVAEIKAYGSVTPFTSAELIDVTKRLAAFGVETDKLVGTTKRLGDLAGATGASIGELALAYGQVMSKGRVQTEELLQFQERGIGIQSELQKMYGLSGAAMQEAISKGQVPAEALEVAIIRLTNAGGKYANGAIAQSDTLNGKLSTLQDSIQTLAQTIGAALTPAFKWALDQAITVTNAIQRMLDLANSASGQQRELGWQKEASTYVEANFPGLFNQGQKAEMYQRRMDQHRADYDLANKKPATVSPSAAPKIPALTSGTGSGTGSGSRSGGRSGGRSGSGGPNYPEYITANQMRTWLKTQGFDRTSGDYTNRGHRTPNHMLNAIDTGVLTGPYNQAVTRAKGMEARLRATGAFGTQLFGPGRDPVGHKDHVHIPTPGGRIKVTAGLARLMGLGGAKGSMNEKEADWTADSADAAAKAAERAREEAARKAEEAARDLLVRKDRLAISEAELKILKASTPEQKIEAEFQQDILRIKQDMAGLTQDDTTKQLEKNLLVRAEYEKREKINELLAKQAQLGVQAAQQQEAALRPLLDDIERLEAIFKGPAAVKALDRRNAIGALTGAGVDPTKAGSLVDQKTQLQDIYTEQQKVEAAYRSIGDTIRQSVGSSISELIRGTATWQEALVGVLDNLAAALLQMGLSGIFDGLGGGGGFLGKLFSTKSFAGGGYTGNGSRSGGIDGMGGFPAILHPNETVIDHSRGGTTQSVGNVNVTVHNNGSSAITGDDASRLGNMVQAAVAATIQREQRPGGTLNRRR